MIDALTVGAPVAGTVVDMAEVPDPVFASAMVGPGLAVDPVRGLGAAVAPLSGRIVKLHPHAFVVVGDGDRGVLVHLGIDTVQLKGAGFELLAAEGDAVPAGVPVVRWDTSTVEARGMSPVCPVVALDAAADVIVPAVPIGRMVSAGDPLFTWR